MDDQYRPDQKGPLPSDLLRKERVMASSSKPLKPKPGSFVHLSLDFASSFPDAFTRSGMDSKAPKHYAIIIDDQGPDNNVVTISTITSTPLESRAYALICQHGLAKECRQCEEWALKEFKITADLVLYHSQAGVALEEISYVYTGEVYNVPIPALTVYGPYHEKNLSTASTHLLWKLSENARRRCCDRTKMWSKVQPGSVLQYRAESDVEEAYPDYNQRNLVAVGPGTMCVVVALYDCRRVIVCPLRLEEAANTAKASSILLDPSIKITPDPQVLIHLAEEHDIRRKRYINAEEARLVPMSMLQTPGFSRIIGQHRLSTSAVIDLRRQVMDSGKDVIKALVSEWRRDFIGGRQ